MNYNISNFSLYLFCILAFSPVAVPLASFGNKSVDIVFFDLFFCICSIALFSSKKLFFYDYSVIYSSLAFVIYSLLLGLIGSIFESSLINFISSMKFVKPWLIFIVFCMAGSNFDFFSKPQFFKALTRSVALCVLALVFSQIYIVESLLPRWGSNFLGFETYGFPNTTGQYLGVVLSLLFFGWGIDSRLKVVYVICVFFALITAVMTLSRSGAFVVVIAGILFGILTAPKRFILFLLCFIVIFILVTLVGPPKVFDSSFLEIFDKIHNRINRLSSDDPLSGREEIWSIALNHVNENIFFGALFSPFSLISEHHQSAHNQYIEIFYKVGFLGLFIFLFPLVIIFYKLIVNLYSGTNFENLLITSALVSMLAASIGNFTQPNYTDSLVGGIVFALAGLSIGVRRRYAG